MSNRISRRALVAALPAAAFQPSGELKLPKRVRVAILGLDGHTGEITQPLRRLPDVEIVGISDADPKALEQFGRRDQRVASARRYPDYLRMLDTEKPDIVAVCNNNGERAAAILACADRKMHVVAEKPLAITRPDLARIKKTVAAQGIRLGMLLPMRYSPPYLALKQIVDSGEIGEVAQISAQKSYKAGNRPAWMRNRKTYGSTILWIGIHMFDLMRWTSGRDFTEAAFRMDNGGAATLHMDYYRPGTAPTHGDDRLRLAGAKGVVEYMAATGVTLVTASAKPRVVEPLPAERSLFIEYLDHVYNGRPASLTPEDIYRNCEVTLGAHEAAAEHRIVKL